MKMDKLVFYKNSAHKKAGFGIHESVQNPANYDELNKIPNWRRMLCSMWSNIPFKYAGYSFRSVDHALQFAKFTATEYHDTAYKFTIESQNVIGMSDGIVAYRNRKMVVIPPEKFRIWLEVKKQANYDIVYCKFSQIDIANQVLKLTYPAEIWNSGPHIKTIRCNTLEAVRHSLL